LRFAKGSLFLAEATRAQVVYCGISYGMFRRDLPYCAVSLKLAERTPESIVEMEAGTRDAYESSLVLGVRRADDIEKMF
jgi:hypothetical protein